MGPVSVGRTWRVAALLLVLVHAIRALPPVTTRKGVLLWQVQLSPDQCGSAAWTPCSNVYAVNQSHGDLVWFAFTTDSAAIKAMYLGHHSVYYTTWSGPGLYAVNAANGHVRWQFPLDNWFRYWVKDIDLGHTARFDEAAETYHVVYTTAAGPPARLYGVKTRSGSLRWEYKLPNASVALQDVAGPWDFDFGSTVISRASTNGTSASVGHVSTSAVMVLAVNQPNSNSSWLQAVAIASGTPAWQSQVLNGTQLAELVLQDDLLLATSADAGSVLAWQPQNGTLLWRRDGPFCTTPSPIATLFEGRQLLVMSESCSDLSGLVAVDVATGQEQWAGWSPPKYARPNGNCSSFEVARGSVFFGCSCSIEAKKRGHNSAGGSDVSGRVGSSQHQHQQGPAHDPTGPSDTPGAPDVGHKASITTGVCLYALHSRQGKVRWVVPVPGNASFPSGAQAWGMAPLVREGLAMFFASDRVFAVDADSGKLQWVYQLPVGEALQPWQVPAVDSASGTLVLAAQLQPPQPPGAQVDDATVSGGGVSKTGLSAVSLKDGRLLWHRMMNGTGQQPASGAAGGAQQLLLSQGRVFAEACRGSRCCLRGLNVTTGKQRWGMCLDALQGDDATHPHAKFAIWLVTLITVGSIALLILGACLVYVQRWREERRILYGAGLPASPRHTYQPLPARQSDSEGDD